MGAERVGLQPFVDAQDRVRDDVCAELRAGEKRTHWMWFVFPILRGLRDTSNSVFYGIASLHEAREYLEHPDLGSRLRECIELTCKADKSALAIFGEQDRTKFRACLTLFEAAAPDEPLFANALGRFFEGHRSRSTLKLLKEQESGRPH